MHVKRSTTANEQHFANVRRLAEDYLYAGNPLMPWGGTDLAELYSAIDQSYLPGDEDARAEYEDALERALAALGDSRSELDDAINAYVAATQRATVVLGIALGLEQARMIFGGGR